MGFEKRMIQFEKEALRRTSYRINDSIDYTAQGLCMESNKSPSFSFQSPMNNTINHIPRKNVHLHTETTANTSVLFAFNNLAKKIKTST